MQKKYETIMDMLNGNGFDFSSAKIVWVKRDNGSELFKKVQIFSLAAEWWKTFDMLYERLNNNVHPYAETIVAKSNKFSGIISEGTIKPLKGYNIGTIMTKGVAIGYRT